MVLYQVNKVISLSKEVVIDIFQGHVVFWVLLTSCCYIFFQCWIGFYSQILLGMMVLFGISSWLQFMPSLTCRPASSLCLMWPCLGKGFCCIIEFHSGIFLDGSFCLLAKVLVHLVSHFSAFVDVSYLCGSHTSAVLGEILIGSLVHLTILRVIFIFESWNFCYCQEPVESSFTLFWPNISLKKGILVCLKWHFVCQFPKTFLYMFSTYLIVSSWFTPLSSYPSTKYNLLYEICLVVL